MSAHPVQWQSPQPLWVRFGTTSAAAATAPDQSRPAIFRFATDEFMEQMLGTLARDPAQLGTLIARSETWRNPGGSTEELIERVPIPRVAQIAARGVAALRGKQPVAATVAAASITEQGLTRSVPLKLYQPAHQRFYLVGGTLVCATPGLPERAVVPGNAETVHFVIRRLLPGIPRETAPSALREFAFIRDVSGASWRRVGSDEEPEHGAAQLAPGEEALPLFPLGFKDDAGRSRTLWGGLIPVGRREEYLGSSVDRTRVASFNIGQRQSLAAPAAPVPQPSIDARLTQFKFEVAEPWKVLIRGAYAQSSGLTETMPSSLGSGEDAAVKLERARSFNQQQQMASWLILLDFADYLAAYLPDVWNAVLDDGASAASLSDRRRTLFNWLGDAVMGAGLIATLPGGKTAATTLRAALRAVRTDAVRNGLESTTRLYTPDTAGDAEWPPFHFVLAGVDTAWQPAGPFLKLDLLPTSIPPQVDPEPVGGAVKSDAQAAAEDLDLLTAIVARSLDVRPETDAPPIPFALKVRDALRSADGDPGWFVVRFVYTRRDCGPLHPSVLSAPTQRFQMANFFDPDAPARPIRITLPADTSPAGLRKANRNTAFMISDMLCGQMQRAKGLGLVDLVRSVLPWPLHKDLDMGDGGPCQSGGTSIGMICSLSIPIITICALLLLIIIVSLLDFIFRWLPFFVVCLPVFGLKGKRSG